MPNALSVARVLSVIACIAPVLACAGASVPVTTELPPPPAPPPEPAPPPPARATPVPAAVTPALGIECAFRPQGLSAKAGESILVRCAPCAPTAASAWGTDYYSEDSSVCIAAMHDGVL